MSTPRRKKVSDAIRILQRKRDASARATHLMVGKDPLITYEKALTDQAEGGIVPNSTLFERKIMSTKTSIKRIALVAAAALAIGGFSAVSANAAATATATLGATGVVSGGTPGIAATANAIGDGNHYVTVTLHPSVADGAYTVTSSGTTGSLYGLVSLTGTPTGKTYTNGTNAAGGFIYETGTDNTLPGATLFTNVAGDTATFTVVASSAGTQTITATPINGTSAASTLVITWGSAPAFSAANSSALFVETTTTTPATILTNITNAGTTTDATTAVSKSAGVVGAIRVKLLDNETIATGISGAKIAASVSGPGLLEGQATAGSSFDAAGAGAATSITDSNGVALFQVLSSGVAGVGTITISYTDSSGTTTVISTKTVSFFNTTPSALAATQYLTVGQAGQTIGISASSSNTAADVAHTAAIIVKATDGAGNIVGGLSSGSFTATSSNSNVITTTITVAEDTGSGSNAAGAGYYIVQPTFSANATSGASATLTITWTSSDGLTKVSTAPVTFTVGGALYAVTAAFDKASYDPGSALVLGFTATDSKGNPVYDQDVATLLASGGTAFNYGTGITTTGVAYSFIGGKASLKTYAPLASGGIVATGTYGATAPAAQVGTKFTVSATVNGAATGGDAALALDAANAATDAANNAYDEAQNATQAASDALAAVKALAVQVKALIALVTKIKNKVGA